jgi:hypothetical protein
MSQKWEWPRSAFDDEVVVLQAQDVLVRDTKNASGGVLAFSTTSWRALVTWL